MAWSTNSLPKDLDLDRVSGNYSTWILFLKGFLVGLYNSGCVTIISKVGGLGRLLS